MLQDRNDNHTAEHNLHWHTQTIAMKQHHATPERTADQHGIRTTYNAKPTSRSRACVGRTSSAATERPADIVEKKYAQSYKTNRRGS